MITKEELLDQLKSDLSEPNLKIFKNSVSIECNDGQLSLIVCDVYMKQWIENKCYSLISSYVDCSIVIDVQETEEDSNENNQLELFQSPKQASPSRFNSLFTFDRFIVGNNNRFACRGRSCCKTSSKCIQSVIYLRLSWHWKNTFTSRHC